MEEYAPRTADDGVGVCLFELGKSRLGKAPLSLS